MSSHRHYCTYFDRNYATRGLALYRSLLEHSRDSFTFWVLCLDDDTYALLLKLNLPNIRLVSLAEFEAGDHALLAAKQNRSIVEYYFTCTPSWPRYLLNRFPQVDLLTYVDADLFFFADPSPILKEFGDNSILIVAHDFPDSLRHLETAGIFNVGLLAFRNDAIGKECLDWWRERCLEWCYNRFDNGRYADQKYLDDWPVRFASVHVVKHKGVSLAPWNCMGRHIEKNKEGRRVDGESLILFHFHGMKLINSWLALPAGMYGPPSKTVLRTIYTPYVRALRTNMRLLAQIAPQMTNGAYGIGKSKPGQFSPRFVLACLLRGCLATAF